VTEVGPFVQSALQLTRQVAVTAGLRYDWVTFEAQDRINTPKHPNGSGRRLMSALSGSVGVAVTPTDALTLYGNVGTSFETPTTTELTNRSDSAGGFNPNLNPQTATNYELGARGVAAGRVSYSIALFQAEVRDELIGYQVADTAARGRVFFRNAGRSRHRGVELGATFELVPGVDLTTTWTYSDFRYTSYTITTGTPPRAIVLDGQTIPGIPQHWLHFVVRARPGFAHGAWAELEETHSSGFVVNDALATTTSPWWASTLRLGWDGTVGSVRLRPFVGFNNLFNQAYVSSVVINAAQGRYYEPAPGRNMYVGFSLGAGE
jgi:iron complex outermembrane receptor protein